MADLVKVSEEDLAWLVAGLPALEAARGLLAPGPKVVLLTQGSAGASDRRGARARHAVVAPPVNVVDTIGAGDAFSGGFLAWWCSRRPRPR